jgi:hypothetical protein
LGGGVRIVLLGDLWALGSESAGDERGASYHRDREEIP